MYIKSVRIVLPFFVLLLAVSCVLPISPPTSTAEECMWWAFEHATYKSEEPGKDHWQTPEETLLLGTGDCEDFAILCMWKMRECGLDSALGCIPMKNGTFHAVVVCGLLVFDPASPRCTYDIDAVLYSIPYEVVEIILHAENHITIPFM